MYARCSDLKRSRNREGLDGGEVVAFDVRWQADGTTLPAFAPGRAAMGFSDHFPGLLPEAVCVLGS